MSSAILQTRTTTSWCSAPCVSNTPFSNLFLPSEQPQSPQVAKQQRRQRKSSKKKKSSNTPILCGGGGDEYQKDPIDYLVDWTIELEQGDIDILDDYACVVPVTDRFKTHSQRIVNRMDETTAQEERPEEYTNKKVHQDQIDQLRTRVDAVLKNLVHHAEEDNRTLRDQVQALRGGGSSTTTLVAKPSADTVAVNNTTTNAAAAAAAASNSNDRKQWVVDPYGDQGQYEGDMDDDNDNDAVLPHGKGTMEYTDGRIYRGEWKHGQWHGRGKAVFSNQDVFEGMYHDDQRHGYGKYQWHDGRSYQGEFCMDQRQGHGIYQWPDGGSYEGDFQKGLRHGQGLYTFKDGSVYKGEWQRGKYHGTGECHWEDGRMYKGDWVSGKAHGYGIEIRPDGSIRHDGQWENDKPLRTKK